MGQTLRKGVKAIQNGEPEVLQAFVESADIESLNQHYDGGTLLHFAAYLDRLKMVKILVNAGVDPNITMQSGFLQESAFPFHLQEKTALEIAVVQNHSDVVDFLQSIEGQTKCENSANIISQTFELKVPESKEHETQEEPESEPDRVLPEEKEGGQEEELMVISLSNTSSSVRKESETEVELIKLFSELDISKDYISRFLEEDLHIDDIPHLGEEDLKSIIPKLGPRTRLLSHFEDHKNKEKTAKEKRYFYPVSRPKRGIALVIGNGNWSSVQTSCHRDSVVMKEVFEFLGYEVHHFTDLSANEILIKAREIRMKNHSSFDSFVMFFSGHGTSNAIYGGARSETAEIDALEICELVDMFQPRRCPTLAGKPKVFLWDCCRGSRSDKGPGDDLEDFTPPQYGDYLYGYATAAQFKSYIGKSGTTNGMSIWTYFLYKNLREMRDSHLIEILTVVHSDVVDYAKRHGRKQAANYLSYLTKFVEV